MKTRESGMSDESMWDSFFDPPTVLAKLGLTDQCRDVVDFGCGYGTFTIPAARIAQGIVHAFDIEADMVAATAARAKAAGLTNVRVWQRDFVTDGTGLTDASFDYVMLFNILHAEDPLTLLRKPCAYCPPAGDWESCTGTTILRHPRPQHGHSSSARAMPSLGRTGGIPLGWTRVD